MVTRADLSTITSSDLQTFSQQIQVPPVKLDSNFSAFKAKFNVMLNYVSEKSVDATEANEFTAEQTFSDIIRVLEIKPLLDNGNVRINTGTGKIYKGSGSTENDEIKSYGDLSTGIATQVTAATTQATNAASSASAASSSASAASSSASAASTSATNASNSATSASTSAATAAAYSKKIASIIVFQADVTCTVGDLANNAYFRVPTALNGFNLTGVSASVFTAGTTGTMDIQIHNITQALDMLSTKMTIDSGEKDTKTAATPAVINTSNDNVTSGDQIRIDIDAVHTTPAKGLVVELQFEAP